VSLDSDILNDFKGETNGLLAQLEVVTQALEDHQGDFPDALLEEFAQKIDRVMGAAKTLSLMDPAHQGLQRIGHLAEICKSIGYKAAEKRAVTLVPFFAAFWADTIEVIASLTATIEDAEKNAQIAKTFSEVLQKRLEWLGEKLDHDVGKLAKDFK
jgi:hypothetical protein